VLLTARPPGVSDIGSLPEPRALAPSALSRAEMSMRLGLVAAARGPNEFSLMGLVPMLRTLPHHPSTSWLCTTPSCKPGSVLTGAFVRRSAELCLLSLARLVAFARFSSSVGSLLALRGASSTRMQGRASHRFVMA
jgi:hypothetical protein